MFSTFELAIKYFHFYKSAHNGRGHGVHSPFVFHFILDVLNNGKSFSPPEAIERERVRLTKNKTMLEVEDLGAGSRMHSAKRRSVAQLAKIAVKPRKMSHLLYRLVCKYQPATIVELGTSLGITTAYLAHGAPKAKVITVEGSDAVRREALTVFDRLGLARISALYGNFDHVLPALLKAHPTIDLAYIDGNHRYAPTMDYFNKFLLHSHNNSILVFDDIHWSVEMEQAWLEIQQHPSVRCTIDIFFLGFVFFRPEFRQKQHFTIRY